eukprot:497726-Lingulodinium_polyedra.AAC.1
MAFATSRSNGGPRRPGRSCAFTRMLKRLNSEGTRSRNKSPTNCANTKLGRSTPRWLNAL